FTTDTPDRSLKPVSLDEIDDILAAVRKAQAALYRSIAAMSRDEKIACGAYVYFGFLRPFAVAAGVADELDWSMPRDCPAPLYDMLSQFTGAEAVAEPDDVPYYLPLAEAAE